MIEFSIKGKKVSGEKVFKGELDLRKNTDGSVTVTIKDDVDVEYPWNLLRINQDGTFSRLHPLPVNIGLQLDGRNQIKENK